MRVPTERLMTHLPHISLIKFLTCQMSAIAQDNYGEPNNSPGGQAGRFFTNYYPGEITCDGISTNAPFCLFFLI